MNQNNRKKMMMERQLEKQKQITTSLLQDLITTLDLRNLSTFEVLDKVFKARNNTDNYEIHKLIRRIESEYEINGDLLRNREIYQ